MARFSIGPVTVISDNTDIYETEPVTVAALKTYLQLEGTAYDGPLGSFITSARQLIEQHCNVSLVNKSLRVKIKNPNYHAFPLPFSPIAAVSQVEWQRCRSTKVILDYGTDEEWWFQDEDADQKYIYSTKTGEFYINYTTYADSRTIWQQAIKAQAGYMFNNRDSENRDRLSPETIGLINPLRMNYY